MKVNLEEQFLSSGFPSANGRQRLLILSLFPGARIPVVLYKSKYLAERLQPPVSLVPKFWPMRHKLISRAVLFFCNISFLPSFNLQVGHNGWSDSIARILCCEVTLRLEAPRYVGNTRVSDPECCSTTKLVLLLGLCA